VSLISDLRKFSARSWQERTLFFEAFVLLGLMRAAILLFPFRTIAKMMGLTQVNTSSFVCEEMAARPTAVGWAIQAAAARTHWESACLAQALAGMSMLSRRGVSATIYLGVGKGENDAETISAHAWLCSGDTILTGGCGVERFSAISSFSRSAAAGKTRQLDQTGLIQ